MTMPMRRHAPTWLVLAAACAFVGCGTKTAVENSSVLRLRVDEYRITPVRVEVPTGRLKIVAYNTGILSHNVVVEKPYTDSNGNPLILKGTGVAHPGQQVSVKVTLVPGTYKLVDSVANHGDLGAYATLIVR